MADDRQTGEGMAAGEREQLVHALETRFSPHREAAVTVVRTADRELAAAQEQLERAREAADEPYVPDLLVFMRESVNEEVEALDRKTNAKKVRAAYRFLLDRAVELAAGEVRGFHDDQAAAQREREQGIEASEAAVRRATEALAEAQRMHDRVLAAEQSARQGLQMMVEKFTAPSEG